MESFTCIFIGIFIGGFFCPSTEGYVFQEPPFQGRQFNIFNLPWMRPLNSQYAPTYDSTYDPSSQGPAPQGSFLDHDKHSHGYHHRSRLAALEASLYRLQSQLENKGPNCPAAAAASGGKVVGARCYVMNTTPATFDSAQTTCTGLGGTLFDPFPVPALSQALYSNIKQAFPTEFATIETAYPSTGPQCWLGVIKDAGNSNLNYLIDGICTTTGPPASPVFSCPPVTMDASIFPGLAPPATATRYGAVIKGSGLTWTLEAITTTNLRPFVCRFDTI